MLFVLRAKIDRTIENVFKNFRSTIGNTRNGKIKLITDPPPPQKKTVQLRTKCCAISPYYRVSFFLYYVFIVKMHEYTRFLDAQAIHNCFIYTIDYHY